MPSGSRDMDEAAPDSRGSTTPAALPFRLERRRTTGGALHWPHTATGA
jgi:hypothetical protein